jgi:molybdopterin-guanine dinucleotide biosynthesis protein A
VSGVKLPVYILGGGRSERFGSDKALARWLDRPLILHVADALRDRAETLTVVAERPDKYAELGLRTIADSGRRRGPLDGLAVALADLAEGEGQWLLLCACDQVGLKAPWVDRLLAGRTSRARAVAFRGARWHPLFALYHRELSRVVLQQLEGEDAALWRVLDAAAAMAVPPPADWDGMVDINGADDLLRLPVDD